MTKAYYAHIRKANGSMLDAKASAEERQCISEHLLQTGMLAQAFSGKIRLNSAGKLMGLLHDLGKYSDQFQHYLLSAQGLLDQDCDDFIDAAASKGKIDHSTAGAQYVASRLKQCGKPGLRYGRLLALGMASHHSGLIDSLAIDGTDAFGNVMEDDALLVVVNRSGRKQEIVLDFFAEQQCMTEASVRFFRDIDLQSAVSLLNETAFQFNEGLVGIQLEPYQAEVLEINWV